MQGRPMNATSLARAMRQAAATAGETGTAVPAHLKPISDDEVKAARVVLGLMQSNEEFLTATGMTPDEIQRYTQPEPKDEDPGDIGGVP
jgi:hypothetical protein